MRLVFSALAAALVTASGAWAAGPVTATMTTSSTTPVAGVAWRYTVTVRTHAGDPLRARVRLQVLRGSRLVGCWMRSEFVRCRTDEPGSWIAFEGRRSGAIVWPARWTGLELTFRAVVVTGMHLLRLRAPVTVRATG